MKMKIEYLYAPVAESADAHGSGPCVRKDIGVQVREPFLREYKKRLV